MIDQRSGGAPLPVPLPDHVKVSRDGLNLVLDVRWFRPYHLLSLVVTIVFVAVFYHGLRQTPKFPFDGYLLLPAVIVTCSAYSGLAGLVNHTRVTVGDGVVDVRLGPLPWWGSKRLPAGDIRQVFCDEVRTRTRSGVNVTYHVNVVTPQGEKHRLVPGLATSDVALYLEQEIERALGITDRKVPGELEK